MRFESDSQTAITGRSGSPRASSRRCRRCKTYRVTDTLRTEWPDGPVIWGMSVRMTYGKDGDNRGSWMRVGLGDDVIQTFVETLNKSTVPLRLRLADITGLILANGNAYEQQERRYIANDFIHAIGRCAWKDCRVGRDVLASPSREEVRR